MVECLSSCIMQYYQLYLVQDCGILTQRGTMLGNVLLLFVLACIAYVILPACQRAFLSRSYDWQWCYPTTAARDGTATVEPKPIEAPEFPAKLQQYIDGWYDGWVREDTAERAKRLWFELSNWELVYQALLEQDKVKVND